MEPLVEHDHLGAGQRQGARRRQAARSGADHQHLAGDLLGRPRGLEAEAVAAGDERTVHAGRTLVRQARWLGRPSTVTRHSKQTPMPQNGPRGAPERAWRTATTSDAASAAAMVSPSSASISRPSKRKPTGEPVGRMSGCFRRMAKGLQWASFLCPPPSYGGGYRESRRGDLKMEEIMIWKLADTQSVALPPSPTLPRGEGTEEGDLWSSR